ncbi:zinc-binding alcohol dehydrogenase family protein [Longilinea arvoryzae]|uniref:alcohol dehydrogenase n=1 Tax=Longilinea arvoryzae TaxID=360412 RepID=A0A0S7BHM3_9CHLR|nr:zinc-dependent alcohol dehydrogenase family protein [Longilinea arvoryzae]GAP15165.1 zinc-binding alcohol dehydrogenase family protein [Longilinea arvoryzae]
MRAMQLNASGPAESLPLRLQEVEIPEPGENQVLIQVRCCGVCHTDLHLVEGELIPPQYPLTPGHQVVGLVVKAGAGVEKSFLGQRVGVYWLHSACGHCECCRRGLENLCPTALFTGYQVPGGYADFLLADARFMVPIPDNMIDEQAAPLLCAGIIGYRALKLSDLKPGERLGLFGFGASAHLALQVARHWKCEVSVFTRSKAHQQHALELGAGWVGTAEQTPPNLLDRAILFAPAGELVPQALRAVRPGGTVAINAVHMSPIPALPYALIYGERTLRSVANVTR